MKRWISVFLSLCLLCAVPALADVDEWVPHESVLSYTMLYPDFLLRTYGVPREEMDWDTDMFVPLEEGQQASLSVSLVSDPSWPDWEAEGYVPVPIDEPDIELEVYLEKQFSLYRSADGASLAEEIRLIPDAGEEQYVIILRYPDPDDEYWRDIFAGMLETMEIPRQPARAGSMVLSYELLPDRFYDEVTVDDEGEPFFIYPDAGVTDFVLEKLSWDDETFTVTGAEALYESPLFTGVECVRVIAFVPDFAPDLRIRCKNPAGEEERWYLTVSGMDGSLLLLGEEAVMMD